MRKPVAADTFYTSDPIELYKEVRGFIVDASDGDVKVAIAPHAGYSYSGRCAGEVYSRLSGKVDTVILIGPNHSGIGSAIGFSFQNFLMPFGKIEIDIELAKKIMYGAIDEELDAVGNDEAHSVEHSLEVQLPFLQVVLGNKTKIVPIIIGEVSYDSCLRLAKIIQRTIKDSNKNIKVIISSDFTHYGEMYGFIPFKEDIRVNMYNLDKKSIEFITEFDSRGFYDYALKNATICGVFAIVIGMEIAKLLGCKKAENVCYYNSGDLTKDYSVCVNYAGIVFK